jgi:beta-aspartyl-peptidase (threonine type)
MRNIPRLFVSISPLLLGFGLVASCQRDSQSAETSRPTFGIVIHGGAGAISRKNLKPEREAAVRAKLAEAVTTGHRILQNGGTSLDAVEATIRVMEDSPLFNAGKGAVFTSEGTNELDACIMDGRTLKAGAVAGVRHIKNPISLARVVMEKSRHVMLVGDGAEKFAVEQGVGLIDQKYFFTQDRWDSWQRAREREKQRQLGQKRTTRSLEEGIDLEDKHGTVGAVAVDKAGNLAAATSTGGTQNKRFGRVGDCPIVGAGTYANNHTCAMSASGTGEYFIRLDVGHDISALMEYRGLTLEQAANIVIKEKLTRLGGDGGIIAIDRQGHIVASFNTSGMWRAHMLGNDGKAVVDVF